MELDIPIKQEKGFGEGTWSHPDYGSEPYPSSPDNIPTRTTEDLSKQTFIWDFLIGLFNLNQCMYYAKIKIVIIFMFY